MWQFLSLPLLKINIKIGDKKMKIKKLKLEISNWKLVTVVMTLIIAVCTVQNGTAAEMKSAGWPNAGVVWTTAETIKPYSDRFWTNFPNWNHPAPSNPPPTITFDMKLSKKEIKFIEKVNNSSKKSTLAPSWPTEFGPYYNGYGYVGSSSSSKIVPTGMFTDGENYFIVYYVNSNSNSYERLGYKSHASVIYDVIDNNYNFKSIYWYKSIEIQTSQAYVQKIDKAGNLISDLGIPITTPSEYEKYQFSYERIHYYTNSLITLHSESTNYVKGSIAAASLVDCGKNLLISGQRTKPGIGWRAKPEVVEGGIYYVLSNSLEKLEWPSWCSGKFVGLSSGHKTSGRENKYIHAFGGDSGKRVWRLLPR